MSSIIFGLVAFVCAFGGALLGLFLRSILPDHHLREDSKDAVKTGAALVATLAALVLGLLISSSKNSLDAMNTAFAKSGAQIIMLDRVLTFYGPEAKEVREQLRDVVQARIERIWPKDKTEKIKMPPSEGPRGMELVVDKLRALTPQNESQRSLHTLAMQIGNDLMQSHWLVIEEAQLTLPTMFLMVLLFWLTILFISIGLFSPCNSTIIAVMVVCAISVSCAIFLIEDMSRPFHGVMRVSSAPLVKALEHLSR